MFDHVALTPCFLGRNFVRMMNEKVNFVLCTNLPWCKICKQRVAIISNGVNYWFRDVQKYIWTRKMRIYLKVRSQGHVAHLRSSGGKYLLSDVTHLVRIVSQSLHLQKIYHTRVPEGHHYFLREVNCPCRQMSVRMAPWFLKLTHVLPNRQQYESTSYASTPSFVRSQGAPDLGEPQRCCRWNTPSTDTWSSTSLHQWFQCLVYSYLEPTTHDCCAKSL